MGAYLSLGAVPCKLCSVAKKTGCTGCSQTGRCLIILSEDQRKYAQVTSRCTSLEPGGNWKMF